MTRIAKERLDMKHPGRFLIFLPLLCGAAAMAEVAPKADCNGDQADRRAYIESGKGTDWTAVASRDLERQRQVIQDLRQGRIQKDADYYCASLILLHAGDETQLRLSFALAVQAQSLFPDEPRFGKLAARAWDRLMMARQQPQWFATQFETRGAGSSEFRLYSLAPGVMSETERARLGGLSDAEVQAELRSLNAGAKDSAKTPSTDGAVAAAKAEERRYAVKLETALLQSTLDLDLSLANFLALSRQGGLKGVSSTAGDWQGRSIFIPRSKEALRAYFDGRVQAFPMPEGSATPVTGSVAEFKLEGQAPGMQRLTVGIDDEVQAAAVLVVRPSRYFELLIEQDVADGGLVVKSVRALDRR